LGDRGAYWEGQMKSYNLEGEITMKTKCYISYILISFLIIIICSMSVLAGEKQLNTVTFRGIAFKEIFIGKNLKIDEKEYGEDKDTSFYMITGLNSSEIEIKAFRDKKIVWIDKLQLINKLSDGTIYLYERSGAGFINLWTIIPTRGIVICTKQYPDIHSERTRVATYINNIESAF
jgi:hypothetical protein